MDSYACWMKELNGLQYWDLLIIQWSVTDDKGMIGVQIEGQTN